MSNVKIKKAKIKDAMFLEVEYSEDLPGHNKKDTKLSCTVPIHEDLVNAFKSLDKHLAVLCEGIKCPKALDRIGDDDLLVFTAKGISIGGSGDDEGIVISGMREGTYGIINLVTPFQKYSTSDYQHINDLRSEVAKCVFEVIEYLFEGKRAPDAQLEIEFEEY